MALYGFLSRHACAYSCPLFPSSTPKRLTIFTDYILRLFFWSLALRVAVLLNILYLVFCFPIILRVRQRHHNVLEDEEESKIQRQESIMMLGELPKQYHDYQRMEKSGPKKRTLVSLVED